MQKLKPFLTEKIFKHQEVTTLLLQRTSCGHYDASICYLYSYQDTYVHILIFKVGFQFNWYLQYCRNNPADLEAKFTEFKTVCISFFSRVIILA